MPCFNTCTNLLTCTLFTVYCLQLAVVRIRRHVTRHFSSRSRLPLLLTLLQCHVHHRPSVIVFERPVPHHIVALHRVKVIVAMQAPIDTATGQVHLVDLASFDVLPTYKLLLPTPGYWYHCLFEIGFLTMVEWREHAVALTEYFLSCFCLFCGFWGWFLQLGRNLCFYSF